MEQRGKHQAIVCLLIAFLLGNLLGCGSVHSSDITCVTSKKLSATAELSDYQVVNGSFSALITIDNAPELRYLADDTTTMSDWSALFSPSITFDDGTEIKLVINNTTVNQKGSDVVSISFEVEAYIQSEIHSNTLTADIHIDGFDSDFSLSALKLS